MGQTTKIQWADATFNPWRGCTKVSAGCANCYAETLSKRNPGVLGVWGDNGTRVVASESKWREPLKWDREAKAAGVRRRVFFSLGDPFEDREELEAPRRRLFDLIETTPNLDWLLLTKRPENLEAMLPWTSDHAGEYRERYWNNVWLGVSAENQEQADKRIPILLSIPAAVRFVSCEPMLGPVDFFAVPRPDVPHFQWRGETGAIGPKDEPDDFVYQMKRGIDWIIFGGESGPNARPCDIQWIRDGVKQCKQAGVKAFVKQLGAAPIGDRAPGDGLPWGSGAGWGPHKDRWQLVLRDPKGGDMDEWPEDLRVREVPT